VSFDFVKIMKKKDKNKIQSKNNSSTARLLVFVLVAAAVSGYLFFKARSESSVLPEDEKPVVDSSESPAPRPKAVAAGDRLPPVPLTSLAGEALEFRLAEGAKPVLLYLFSPTCSICTKTIPAWKEIAKKIESVSVEVLGISMMEPGATAQYADQHQLPWNVYCVAGTDSIRALRVQSVPTTLILEGSGDVALAFQGQLSSEQIDEITQYLTGDESEK
jgi:peroxiredoxin